MLFPHRTGHQIGALGRGDRPPDSTWVTQQARNLLLVLGKRGRPVRFNDRKAMRLDELSALYDLALITNTPIGNATSASNAASLGPVTEG